MRLHLDLACVKLNETQVQLTKTQEKFKEATRKLELNYDVVEKIVQCSEEHNYFKWKISGFSESLRKAKLFEKKNVINSEPFYRYGYKCRLYLAPNGEGSAENTHLSVFFRIMKGENDDILPWPFHKKITLTLIDQQKDTTDRKNIFEIIMTDAESPEKAECFSKPVTHENNAWGIVKFASHDELKQRRFIVDDTIIFQVQVSPLQ